jgi:hypothetical protein
MKISFEKINLFHAIVALILIALTLIDNQFTIEYYKPIAVVLIVLLSVKIKKCGSAINTTSTLK